MHLCIILHHEKEKYIFSNSYYVYLKAIILQPVYTEPILVFLKSWSSWKKCILQVNHIKMTTNIPKKKYIAIYHTNQSTQDSCCSTELRRIWISETIRVREISYGEIHCELSSSGRYRCSWKQNPGNNERIIGINR